MGPLISGKSRLVKYYELARLYNIPFCMMVYYWFSHETSKNQPQAKQL